MALNVASIKVSSNAVLPIRIFVNRKRLLQKNLASPKSIVEAPLLSNNSIIRLQSPYTKIFLSNRDLESLCEEIRDDVLLLLYELTSPVVIKHSLNKMRMGKALDFKETVLKLLLQDGESNCEDILPSHMQSITRIAKYRYKLHFQHNWDLEFYIVNLKRLAQIRNYLLFHDPHSYHANAFTNRALMVVEQVQETPEPHILQEKDEDVAILETKPTIALKYRPMVNLGECIEIHVLERPRRHKK